VKAKDHKGKTPLFYADDVKVTNLLFANGAVM
jgi:hypothetical protein